MKTSSWFKRKACSFKGFIAIAAFAIAANCALAQNGSSIKVSGTVIDNTSNEPIPGVNVLLKGTQTGTTTNTNGKYALDIPSNGTLVFSFVGYEEVVIKVGNQPIIDVRLHILVQSLDGIVVIGYGSTTKKEVTGSIATVKSADFNRGAFGDAIGLLQGKVAGLTIVKPDGADPQAEYRIMLRGTNTLTSGQGPLIIIDGVVGAEIKNVSPEEIESFDVLKDGAAAAIYGTRGSNGVIIITTRRAKSGQSKIEYSGQLSAQVNPRGVKNLSANEFRQAIEQYEPDKAVNIFSGNVDWFKEITRPVPLSHKHNLAITGGNETFSHRTTLYVDNAQGLLTDNVSNKYLIRTNVVQKVMGELLTLDYNLSYGMRNYKPANYDLFYQAFIRNPTSPVYDPANTYSGGYTLLQGIEYYNPVAMQKERTREGKTTDTGGNIRATLNLTESLKWVNFISIEQSDWEDLYYRTKYYPSKLGKNGEAEISNGKNKNLQYESTANYLKSIGDNNIQVLAGYSFQELESNTSYMINSGFDSDLYGPHNIGDGSALGVGTAEMGSYKEKSRLISFFGRVLYNYDQKYLASVSLRREGSSRFGKNNKWGWFPSVSLGWRLNKEKFLSDIKWINDIKLRVGYGVTGNQDFANYKSLIMMGTAGKFYYNGDWINTYQPTSNPNPDLRWEKKQELNAGLDFSLFNNRISGVLDYYYRSSTDLLYAYNVPYPPYIFPVLFTNVGTISNQGVEFTLNAIPVKTGLFSWNTTITFSKNSNKLVKFSNAEFTSKYIETGWLGGAFPLNALRIEEGKPLGTFYGPVWLGLDENGYDRFKNANPIGKVDPKDWEPIGNAYPLFTIGWSNMVSWKGWDLSATLRSSIGGKVLNMYRLYYENWQSLGRNIVHTQLENPGFNGIGQYSSKYVEDASFLKLDNLSVGYNLQVHSKYISKIRINLTAQDVLTLSGYKGLDPEVNLSGLQPGIEYLYYYPRTTSVTLGVNVIF
jgi:TonB-linked SusC/RagA family outer membrane protein